MRNSLILSLLAGLSLSAGVWAQDVAATVNGSPIHFDQPPVIRSGRVLVPLRGVFERLGGQVDYDAARSAIRATRAGHTVDLSLGSATAWVDGRSVLLDTPPVNLKGRTLVPLRFLSEALGAQVAWDAPTRTVRISTATAPPVASTPRQSPADPGQWHLTGTVQAVDSGTSTFNLVSDGPKDIVMVQDSTRLTTRPGRVDGIAGLAPGDLVQVVGVRLDDGRIVATRVDPLTDSTATVGTRKPTQPFRGLVLTNLESGDRVPTYFDVQGVTTPGATVQVQVSSLPPVTPGAPAPAAGRGWTLETRADGFGRFDVPVRADGEPRDTRLDLTISVVARDGSGPSPVSLEVFTH